MKYFVGIDGGGTRTTLGIADESGREVIRRVGPAGLVDPRDPAAAAERLVALVRDAAQVAALDGPATALCAGLAGVGNAAERRVVEDAFAYAGVAERVEIISDGEIALHGALAGGPGILLISGTGSVAWGRSETGRVAKAGGWGLILGDEGSGYQIARAALSAALMTVDHRGPESTLHRTLLDITGLSVAEEFPPWVARVEKGEVAALAVHVIRIAELGDPAAREIVQRAAADLGAHVEALVNRLRPWSGRADVTLHGGVATDPSFRVHLEAAIMALPTPVQLVESRADAVTGALGIARALVAPIGDA